MTAIRNLDGKVVCFLDEKTGEIEIKLKGCRTVIRLSPYAAPVIVQSSIKDKP